MSWRSPLAVALLLVAGGCTERAAEPSDAVERPPVIAEASVDRAVATTGDLVTYTLEVEHAPGVELELPELGDDLAGLEIVERGAEGPEERGGRIFLSRWARLRVDLVGSYVLPAVDIAYRQPGGDGEAGGEGSVATSAIFVEVASVLPEEGGADDIRDIKPLQPPPPALPWGWIAALLAAALLAALAVWLWRRRLERPAAPPLPAHEVARRALDELSGVDLDDSAAVRRLHFALSQIVRAYIEGRWGLNATDLTSEEIIASLAELSGLDGEHASSLRRFLLDTDRVKFADHAPRRDEIDATFERARHFVEATRPRPEPEPGAEERAA